MKFQEIFSFLMPSLDPIQLFFFGVIACLFLLTIVVSLIGARVHVWERKWSDGGQNDLDVEHGPLHEISAAVASPGEKMAEFMPGILLILGLLGTFLGLGIALNKASTILVEANAGGGMDNAMTNLMGMMEGLGTKFKTSTWGILAFLLLKAYAALSRYEERRLRWCARQMKRVFDSSRLQQKDERLQSHNALIEALNRLNQNISSQNDRKIDFLGAQFRALKEHGKATLGEISGSRSSIEALLSVANDVLQEEKTSNQMSRDAKHILQQQLDDGKASRQAVEQLSESNGRNLGAVSGAAEQMTKAARIIGDSAGELQKVVGDLKDGVSTVLGQLKKDLGETIGLMGTSFTKNMAQMSGSLSDATQGISIAVNSLSNNVGQTMEGMKTSNEKSLELQRNAHASFQSSSATLQENVQGMTHLIEDLREKILSGLKAVSESGRRMANLDGRYEEITVQAKSTANEVEKLVSHLTKMYDDGSVNAMIARVSMIDQSLQAIGQRLNELSTLAQRSIEKSDAFITS